MYIYFVYCILLASCTFEAWEPFQSCLQEMYTSKVSATKDKAMGKLQKRNSSRDFWMRSSMLWKALMARPSTAGMFQSML